MDGPRPSRDEQIAALRKKLESFETAKAPLPVAEPVSVPDALARLLPGGGLARGVAYSLAPSALLTVELVAHASARGGVVGVIGWPELGLGGVVESGGQLDRIVVVPDPGLEPLMAVAVLVEGLDLVVYKGAARTLSPVAARPLLAKLRGGRASLLMVGTQVPSPAARIDAGLAAVEGIGAGTGRIRGLTLDVEVHAKGHHRRGEFVIGQAPQPRLRAV